MKIYFTAILIVIGIWIIAGYESDIDLLAKLESETAKVRADRCGVLLDIQDMYEGQNKFAKADSIIDKRLELECFVLDGDR